MLNVIIPNVIMLNLNMLNVIYAECHYAECHYAECHYAECHYAECHYAECHGTKTWVQQLQSEAHFFLSFFNLPMTSVGLKPKKNFFDQFVGRKALYTLS